MLYTREIFLLIHYKFRIIQNKRTNIDTIVIIFVLTGILGNCLLKTSSEMKYIIAYKIRIVDT